MKNSDEAKVASSGAAPTNRLKFVFFALLLLIVVPVVISFIINAYEHQLLVLTMDTRGKLLAPADTLPYSSTSLNSMLRSAETAFAAMGRTQDTVQSRIDRLQTIQLLVTAALGVLGILACWYTRAALVSMRNNLAENQSRALALESLFETASHLSLMGSPEETHRYLTERVGNILQAEKAMLWSYDERRKSLSPLLPAHGFSETMDNIALSLVDYMWAADMLHDNRTLRLDGQGAEAATRQFLKSLNANDMLAVPLIARGKPVGMLTASNKLQAAPFTDADERLMRTFAGQAAFVLHSAALYGRTVARNKQLATLAHITGVINSSLDLEETLIIFLKEVHTLVPFRSATLALKPGSDEDSSWVNEEQTRSNAPAETDLLRRLRGKQSLASPSDPGENEVERESLQTWRIERNALVVKHDILRLDEADPIPWVLVNGRSWTASSEKEEGSEQEYSRIVVPLIAHKVTLGALEFEIDPPDSLGQTHLVLARQLAGQLAAAIQNARLYHDARHRAEQLEWAMQESHHRIKNNLQAVSAILDLYLMDMDSGERAPAEGLRHALREIRTIAAVHDLLSEDVRLGRVDMRTLLEMLVPLLVSGPSALGKKIGARVEAVSLMVPSKIASAIALSVNELVINAVQHGGCGRSSVLIQVSLNREAGFINLKVSDDGPGFVDGFDPKSAAGVGLNLVTTLIERDHGGKLEFVTNKGAHVSAVIPYASEPDQRPA